MELEYGHIIQSLQRIEEDYDVNIKLCDNSAAYAKRLIVRKGKFENIRLVSNLEIKAFGEESIIIAAEEMAKEIIKKQA